MALKGTLKDFGIADIFQLISQQTKTGVLYLRSRDQEVKISFVNGNVVSAENTGRKKRDLLGNMLVRAGLINEQTLEQALDIQKRTLKRLGRILLEQGAVSLDDLRQITMLQITETIYKLFTWDSGTYEFETTEVEYDKETVEPIRAENVLMEGFRIVDEWPMVRKVITSYEMTFKRLKQLDQQQLSAEQAKDDIDAAFDDMLGGGEPKQKSDLEPNDVRVFALVEDDRTVQEIIDLSRLGEFETCKSLVNLINKGYIKVDKVRKPARGQEPGAPFRRLSLGRLVVQVLTTVVIVAAVYLLVQAIDFMALLRQQPSRSFNDPAAGELIDLSYRARLETAIQVYKLDTGRYPQRLEQLVEAGLVGEYDLRFPWKERRTLVLADGDFRLLRPFK